MKTRPTYTEQNIRQDNAIMSGTCRTRRYCCVGQVPRHFVLHYLRALQHQPRRTRRGAFCNIPIRMLRYCGAQPQQNSQNQTWFTSDNLIRCQPNSEKKASWLCRASVRFRRGGVDVTRTIPPRSPAALRTGETPLPIKVAWIECTRRDLRVRVTVP
jgi:hypothetical protein